MDAINYREGQERKQWISTGVLPEMHEGRCDWWCLRAFTDILRILTSDVLHQLYQGVFKHVVNWCQSVVGAKRLDQRIRSLPQFQGIRHFKNGISALSQISGPEHKDMAKILIPCLAGTVAPQGIKAVKGLLDFIFLSQYPTHDEQTLKYMEDTLDLLHKNKNFFIEVGCHIRKSRFDPRLH
jgi:hypothetical protein